jgi:hypothetical protein
MEYSIYIGSKKATKTHTKSKENMHAPSFQDPRKIQFRQKTPRVQGGIKGVVNTLFVQMISM